jgi:hypothetical protein
MAQHATATPVEDNSISVEIGSIGATVADALSAANYPTDSEVRCSGDVYSAGDVLDDGDTLIVLAGAKVKGA